MSFSPAGFAPSALLKCATSSKIKAPPQQQPPGGSQADQGTPVPVVFGTVTVVRTQIIAVGGLNTVEYVRR